MEDNAIIALLFERDEAALDAAREKYGPYCSAIAAGILRDARDAEECVSDALLRLWDSVPPERPASLRAYLGRLTRNRALNALRDSKRRKRGGGEAVLALEELADCVPAPGSTEGALEAAELTACLDIWLASLSREQRVAFVRRYWYLDSIGSLAARMGWSKSKTTSLLARLRASLRDRLISEGIEI